MNMIFIKSVYYIISYSIHRKNKVYDHVRQIEKYTGAEISLEKAEITFI